jgi:hypothetical protein
VYGELRRRDGGRRRAGLVQREEGRTRARPDRREKSVSGKSDGGMVVNFILTQGYFGNFQNNGGAMAIPCPHVAPPMQCQSIKNEFCSLPSCFSPFPTEIPKILHRELTRVNVKSASRNLRRELSHTVGFTTA